MTTIVIDVIGAAASATVDGLLTSGMVGVKAHVNLSNEQFDGLTATAVVKCGGRARRMVIDAAGDFTVPYECLIAQNSLKIGIDAVSEDGAIRIPTIWAFVGTIQPSVADAEAEQPDPLPTPSEFEQIRQLAYKADVTAKSVRQDADAGKFDGAPGKPGKEGPPGPPGPTYDDTEIKKDLTHKLDINNPQTLTAEQQAALQEALGFLSTEGEVY